MFWTAFLIGLFVGAFLGFMAAALMAMAGRESSK